jgi:hypothetical protein
MASVPSTDATGVALVWSGCVPWYQTYGQFLKLLEAKKQKA